MISAGVNFLTIQYIGVDRYIFIAHPLRYHSIVTRTRVFIVIGLCWFLPATSHITLMQFHQLKMGVMCKFAVFLPSFAAMILILEILVIAGITVMFYIAISRIAYQQGELYILCIYTA